MKAIQITVDERLLQTLDEDQEVKRDGRSAVIRRAVRDYLKRRRGDRVAEQYRKGYGAAPPAEFEPWQDEQVWLED